MRRTGIIGEYRQSDGWHIAQPFESPAQAREWAARVDESEGHHYARRWRRVRINSSAYSRALHIEFHATMEAAFDAGSCKKQEMSYLVWWLSQRMQDQKDKLGAKS